MNLKCINCGSPHVEPFHEEDGDFDDIIDFYLRQIENIKPIKNAKKEALLKRILKGSGEHKDFVKHYLYIAVEEAEKHHGKGVPFLSLIEVGNRALYRSIDLMNDVDLKQYVATAERVVRSEIVSKIMDSSKRRTLICKQCEFVMNFRSV
jgi:DNA-directed RNA polymerase sigma subunit (sigma70/sigma32)